MNHRGPVPARVLLTVSHPDNLALHANAKLARIVCYQTSESVEEGHGGVNQTSRRVSKWKVLPRARHTVLLSVADQRCFEQNHSMRITLDVEEHLTILGSYGRCWIAAHLGRTSERSCTQHILAIRSSPEHETGKALSFIAISIS